MLHRYLINQSIFVFITLFYFLLVVSSEKIYFPDDVDVIHEEDLGRTYQDRSGKLSSEEEENEIPLDLIQKLNSIENESQLYKEFFIKDTGGFSKGGIYGMASRLRTSPYLSVDGSEEEPEIQVKSTRIGLLGSSLSGIAKNGNIQLAKAAICQPELQTVPLYESTDRKIVAFPSCTRIERCGGCCQHELLSCQPESSEIVNSKVILMRYENNGFRPMGQEIVPIEKHTSCKCKCQIKKEHCTELQEYIENECKCSCTNKDEAKKCLSDSQTKLWDPHSCSCKCREIKDCSSGQFFSENTCSCETIRALTRGQSSNEKTDYNVYRIIPSAFLRKERH